MAGDAWFPLYTGDYLRDTMHLTTEEHGAYLLLLMSCWSAGGELDADDESLAAITRLPADRWRAMSRKLLRFFEVTDGVLTHSRVSREIERAQEQASRAVKGGRKRMDQMTPEERSELASKAAMARWPKCQPNASEMPAECQPPQPPPQPHSYTTTTNPVVVEIQNALIRCGVTSAKAAESAIAAGGPEMTLEALAWLEGQRVAGVLPFGPAVIYGRLTQAGRASLPASQGWDDRPSSEYVKAVEKSKQAARKLRESVERIPIPELTARHGPWADGLDLSSERVKLERENQVWRMEPDSKVRVELMRRKEMEVRNAKAEAG